MSANCAALYSSPFILKVHILVKACEKTNLGETDVLGLLTEALSADVHLKRAKKSPSAKLFPNSHGSHIQV